MPSSMAPALAGFYFSVIFIVIVCFRFACTLLHRRRAPALSQYAVSHFSFAVHVGCRGLDPAAVAALPTRAFAAAGCGGLYGADSQCVICLHHFFADLWLEQNSAWPICRISLLDNADGEHNAPPPIPGVVISLPSSPESPRSDPCRWLFASTGHSSMASEAPRHEPDQNQVASAAPSVDGANNMPLSEGNPTPENNSQTVRKQADRSTQLLPHHCFRSFSID